MRIFHRRGQTGCEQIVNNRTKSYRKDTKNKIKFLIKSVWCFGAQIKNQFGFCLKQNQVVASTTDGGFAECMEQNFNSASTGPCSRK